MSKSPPDWQEHRRARRCWTFAIFAALGLAPTACSDPEGDDSLELDELELVEDALEPAKKPEKPKKPKKIKPLCVGDQCSDAYVDTRINYSISNFEFPAAALAVGTELRIFGHEYVCYDSPCAISWAVVRDLDTGDLISGAFGRPFPSAQVLSPYGETPESWLAPLTVEAGDFGNCEPYDAGCGDDTVLQRGAVEFAMADQSARILDRTHGWAPAGYYANVANWRLGNASCQYALWSGRANVIRSGCAGDCPEPEVADACGAGQGPYDEFRLQFLGLLEDPEGPFDATCQVIAVLDQVVSLDCVYSLVPGEFEPPAD